jgi:hypothetical protein
MTFGAIALLLALVHFWGGPFSPQPSLEQTVADTAAAIKEATLSALKGEEAPPPEPPTIDLDRATQLTTSVLGGLALILGLVGFVRHESLRAAGSAAALGTGAIAFQFLVLAIGAIVLAILVASVLHHFDF